MLVKHIINLRNRFGNIYVDRKAESHLSDFKVTPTSEPAAAHPANKACSEACSLSAVLRYLTSCVLCFPVCLLQLPGSGCCCCWHPC